MKGICETKNVWYTYIIKQTGSILKMKKKILAVVLAGALALSFAGCGAKGLSDEYVTISQIEKLEVPKVEHTVITDEIVDYVIEGMLNEQAVRTEVKDRAVANGDIVVIDYKGFVDGVEFEGGKAEGSELEIGSNTFIGATDDYKGFEEQIIGHKAGEKFDIEVQFPAEYPAEDLKSKVATFKITLHQIFENEVPELNDEYVKSVSKKSSTLEEYKKEIKEDLEKKDKEQVETQLASAVLGALAEKTEVKKFPDGVVDKKVEEANSYYNEMAANAEMEFSDFCQQYLQITEEEYNELVREVAEEEVKVDLACKLIAKEKNLEPSKEEYDEMVKELAGQSGIGTPTEFEEMVGEDIIESLIIQQRVGAYLAKTCVQVEK